MTEEAATHRLRQAVQLNEGAKQILHRTLAVDLLALDALVQSRKAGESLRGFEAVSRQMRTWTGQLRQQVAALAEATGAAVLTESGIVRLAAQKRLMGLTAAASKLCAEALAPSLRRLDETLRVREQELVHQQLRLSLHIDGLRQLALMATVLARSAMIEAEYADGSLRESLGQVSREFAHSAADVVKTIALLRQAMEDFPP